MPCKDKLPSCCRPSSFFGSRKIPTGYFQSVSPVTLVFLYCISFMSFHTNEPNIMWPVLYVCVWCPTAEITWRVVTGWHVLHSAFISTTHALPQSCHWCRCSFICWHLKSVCVSVCYYYMSTGSSALVSVEKCVGVCCESSRNDAERKREWVWEPMIQSLWNSSSPSLITLPPSYRPSFASSFLPCQTRVAVSDVV